MLPNITNVFTDFMIIYFGDNTFPDIVAVTFAGYPDFTKAMLARGWFQNEDKDRLASSQQTESVTAKLWPFHLLLSILVPRTRLREVGYLIIIYIYIYNIVYYIYTSLVYILCVYTWYIYIYIIYHILKSSWRPARVEPAWWVKDSRFFDMKWAPAAAMDHDNLLPGQAIAQPNPQELEIAGLWE